MITEQSLTKSWEKIGRYEPVSSHLTFHKNGLMLGAGTVIVPSGRDDWGRPVLKIDGNEERILALLSVAHDQPVMPRILDNLRSASRCWCKGENTLAYIHIAFSGLQALEDEDAPRRLFMAKRLLDHGMDEAEMLKGLDLLPQCFTPWSWQQLVKEFNPDQARDDHGRWTSDNQVAATLYPPPAPFKTWDAYGEHLKDITNSVGVTHQPGESWQVSNFESVTDVAGTGKYYGQCVSLVKDLTGMPATSEWRAGDALKGYNDPPLQPGTVIATMDENGRYPGPEDDDKHAAIFVRYEEQNGKKGMVIYDQYLSKKEKNGVKSPSERFIPFDDKKSYINNAYSYSVVTTKR